MNKTLQKLAEISEEHRFEEKLLFVPSYAVGNRIGEALAREGHPWINIRFNTVLGCAQELAGLNLARNHISFIDSMERFLIVEAIFRSDEKLNSKGSYFEGASEVPGILKCLADSIYEMRMEGFSQAEIDPSCFLVPEKGKALCRLLHAYEVFLEENSLEDEAGLVTEACRVLENGKASCSPKIVMVLSGFVLSNVEKNLICLVGGDDLIVLGQERIPGLRYPKRFLGDELSEKYNPKGIGTDLELLPFVHTPENAPQPRKDGSVSLFHALGESNEVREVLRRVVASRMPLDDVEIVLTKRDPYVSLVYETVKSLDLPATFSGGIPITYTLPGRALALYLQWQMDDFLERHLRQLFAGGYLDTGPIETAASIPFMGKICAMLREAGIGWGRDRTLARISALKAKYISKAEENKANDDEEKAIRSEERAAQIEGVLKYV